MTRYKHHSKKKRLIKANNRTRWAPVFAIVKKYGKGKRVHPSYMSAKRSWRRNHLKA
jgi:ribosomal protein L39E